MRRRVGALDRRRFLRYSGASAATLGLAGCQSITSDEGGEVTGTPTDDPLKVGLIVPRPDGLGETVVKSARLGVDVVNREGGIDGRDVELVLGDATGGAAAARRAYNRLTTKEGVEGTVGSLETRAIMPAIAEQQKLHVTTMSPDPLVAKLVSRQVSPMGGDPEAEYEKYKYHFRAGPMNYLEMLDAALELLDLYGDDLGWQTISILFEPLVERADELLEGMVEKLTARGKDIAVTQAITSGIDDFSPIFDDIEAAGTDVCAIVSGLTGIPLVRQWADQERQFEMGGAHLFGMFPWFWEETGGAAEGLFLANAITPQSENTPHTQVFMDRYRDRYGADAAPVFAGPITYDAIRAMRYGYEQLGVVDTEEIVAYLENEFHWTGSTIVSDVGLRGPDEKFAHDIIWDCMEDCEGSFDDGSPHGPTGVPVWQQWQRGPDGDGVMEVFAPSMNKTADYVKPPWIR